MNNLKRTDPQIYNLVKKEEERQRDVLEMIASENYSSLAVMETLGTVLTNKYSEGYPRKRYYQGNRIIDDVETLAQERAQKLFRVPYVNVQPLSGSPANSAVEFALLTPGVDKIMGLSLAFGGHLTHGSPVSFSGKYFKIVPYFLNAKGILDYDAIEKLAVKEKPKLIICGFTAYSRTIDFKRFGEIADRVGAYLMADIAHIAGLVAGGAHPSPAPNVHVITTTTHKTLRGPRGAMIMITQKGLKKDPDLIEKIDKAVFPGLQGGPHDNQTAAIAVALLEASKPSFKKYAQQIVKNAKTLANELQKRDFTIVSGGTDNHLMVIDLNNKKTNGAVASLALEVAGIVLNKNAVPNDQMPPFYPSGLRLGTPAITTRGMKEKEMKIIAMWIDEAVKAVSGTELKGDKEERKLAWAKLKKDLWMNRDLLRIAKEVRTLCLKFPIY